MVSFCFFGAIQDLVAQVQCQDTVKLDLISSLDGNQVVVTLNAKNINEAVGLFFKIGYDGEVVVLDSISSLIDGIENFEGTKGLVNFLWLYNPSVGPISIADDESIVTLYYTIQDPFAKAFFSVQLPEVIVDNRIVCVAPLTKVISLTNSGFSGVVYSDRNLDCMMNPDEQGLQNYIIELRDGQSFYRITDPTGNFAFEVPPGIYRLSVYIDEELWTLCTVPTQIEVLTDQILELNIGLRPVQVCPHIAVSVTAPKLENCRDNHYNINYQNIGNAATDEATVELTFDRDFTLVSTNFSNFLLKPNTIVFEIGRLEVNESGAIEVIFNVNCFTTYQGQTHCVEAIASPRGLCGGRDNYSGPSITITSDCDEVNDKAIFTIKNVGMSGMPTSSGYIVTEDDVLKPGGSFMLNAQEEVSLAFDADGGTYRITTTQSDLFPTKSIPTLALDGCGNVPVSQKSKGFVNIFENDDRDLFKDIDCQVIENNTPPMYMRSYPTGVGSKNFIAKDIYIEYLVTFKHITNEMLNSVLIKNPISPLLDIATLEMSGSSHPVSFSINKDRELYVTMDSLNIKNDRTKPNFGLGYVKYKIKVDSTASLNAIIVNKADVHLNYGLAASTNFVVLTIGEIFLVDVKNGYNNLTDIKVYPNPVSASLNIIGNDQSTRLTYEIIPLISQNPVAAGILTNNYINMEAIAGGVYLLRLTDQKNRTSIYKITKL